MSSIKRRTKKKAAKLHIEVATLFPGFFKGPLDESIVKRAQKSGDVLIDVHDIRRYAESKHNTADDKPFGGGPGMLMKPEPIFKCIEDVTRVNFDEKKKRLRSKKRPWIVLLDPKGKPFTQKVAASLIKRKHLLLIAGHYEGVDHRVREYLIDEEISVGDYVTMGGEAPAMCMIEAMVRLVPGVLGNQDSIKDESFQGKDLEYPHYTRPREYRGMKVPDVLISGNHRDIQQWRKKMARSITKKRRPDLHKS